MSRVVGALALCVFLAASLSAQSITGSITGVVTDSSGAVIPGAEITVINLGTNVRFTAKSDPGGNYTAPLCLAAAIVWKSPPAASNDSSRKASFFRTANRPRRCSVGRRRSGRLRHRDRGRREARDGERHAGESRRQPTITNMPLNTRNV